MTHHKIFTEVRDGSFIVGREFPKDYISLYQKECAILTGALAGSFQLADREQVGFVEYVGGFFDNVLPMDKVRYYYRRLDELHSRLAEVGAFSDKETSTQEFTEGLILNAFHTDIEGKRGYVKGHVYFTPMTLDDWSVRNIKEYLTPEYQQRLGFALNGREKTGRGLLDALLTLGK